MNKLNKTRHCWDSYITVSVLLLRQRKVFLSIKKYFKKATSRHAYISGAHYYIISFTSLFSVSGWDDARGLFLVSLFAVIEVTRGGYEEDVYTRNAPSWNTKSNSGYSVI